MALTNAGRGGGGGRLDWPAFRLTTPGGEFEVHAPAGLTAHLRRLAARLTRAPAAGGSGCAR
uniref:Uncharacterized protein n=1 Tax=Nonomuraea gerenzanensis TaxID=93944 RepID=A0A1M4EE03_9ACTN|nr:hypothetical protein BN4615_P6528 [Nonomuraea gerenzanensis]